MPRSAHEFSGRLRERVRIEQRIAQDDGSGRAGDAWSHVGTAWVQVEPVPRAAAAAFEADTRLTAKLWRLTMRAEFRPLLDMRLHWRGTLLRIAGVTWDPAIPDRTIILAEELGP